VQWHIYICKYEPNLSGSVWTTTLAESCYSNQRGGQNVRCVQASMLIVQTVTLQAQGEGMRYDKVNVERICRVVRMGTVTNKI